jgi:hypothetical protein
MSYSARIRVPNEARANKDERRKPRFVMESVKNAVKLYVDVLVVADKVRTLTVKVREIGKHAHLLIDVEGRQHVPTMSTGPMAADSRDLVDVSGPQGTPLGGLLLRVCGGAAKEYETNQRH